MKNVPLLQVGYTLVELVVTITIIGVIATIVVPGASSNSDRQLQLAAEQFAAAMRFARSESMRSGNPIGFHEESGDKSIQVFRLDTATNPATLIYDVYHPIDKSLYDIDLDLHSLASADSISRNASFRGACNQQNRIYFDSNGTPWCSDPTTVLLDNYQLHLYSGTAYRLITLDGVSGRVTVQ